MKEMKEDFEIIRHASCHIPNVIIDLHCDKNS